MNNFTKAICELHSIEKCTCGCTEFTYYIQEAEHGLNEQEFRCCDCNELIKIFDLHEAIDYYKDAMNARKIH